MKMLVILVAKLIIRVGKLVHRGSTLPGDVALRMDPDILSKIEIPKLSVAVTGTTGKTSTTQTIADVFASCGYKVAHNLSGANLIGGVATLLLDSVTLSGKCKKDVLVLEVDERYAKLVFQYFQPTYFVVTNLSRDQLARHGHYDVVYDDIARCITDSMHLVLNADDPFVCKLALNHKGPVTYFGIKETAQDTAEPEIDTLDLCYCPKCHEKLHFDRYHYGNLGIWNCPNHDYDRPECAYEVTGIDMENQRFTINGSESVAIQHDILYNIYNNLVVYAISDLCRLDRKTVLSSLKSFNFTVKRFDTFTCDGRDGYILTSKNETPISYNQSLKYVSLDSSLKTIVVGFKRVSGRYDLMDLSWLWDVNFECLDADTIDHAVCVGPFANELAARLVHAGIREEQIVIEPVPGNTLQTVKDKTKGTIYATVYFDMAKELTKLVESEKRV
ncbi:MAG: DUF1727 domain-containing protein [Erysipelotrichaceae bacterium]|nr:DUF1727 domain-containing protein [Erysipelotrichaceae bacterium]